MIIRKSKAEIEAMKEAGRISAKVLREVGSKVAPGVSTLELDQYAEELIRLEGGREKYIRLTEAGAAFARQALDAVYALEDAAFARTLSRFSPEFVAALADFAQELNAETARFLTEPPQKP